MKIHHIGYLVENIENAAKEFERLGFSKIGEIVTDVSREIYILFLDNAGQIVELIQPVGKTSPLYGLRKKFHNAPIHICYQTNDLQDEINNVLNIGGYALIQPPQPAPAIPGCPNVAFMMNRHIGIVEFVELR